MSSAVANVIKMIEHMPESVQNRVVDHLREYIANYESTAKAKDRGGEPSRRATPRIRTKAARGNEFHSSKREIAAGRRKLEAARRKIAAMNLPPDPHPDKSHDELLYG